MNTADVVCRQCKTAMSVHPVDPVAGEEGALKVTLIQLPAMVCSNRHRRFVSAEFPLLLLERLSAKEIETLPAGRKSGLILKKYQCSGCNAELEKGEGREETFDFDVKLDPLPPFRVSLTLPLHKCTACGKEQMRSRDDAKKLVPLAMARAFKAAGLNPE